MEKDSIAKDKEVETIRAKITEVAELFEKKEIRQRYSFEVLCDFIFDKAKRLFIKLDTANRSDKKSIPLKKNDIEYEELKQILMKNSLLASELTSKFTQLIGEPPIQ